MQEINDLTSAKNCGMSIEGTVWAINEYINQETKAAYHSVDMAIKGTKQMVNVKIPPEFNRSQLVEDDYVRLSVRYQVKNFNGKVTPEFHAVV